MTMITCDGWAETDRKIYWQCVGDVGPAIVMLHEMGGSIKSFDAVVDALSGTSCRILRIDQRGFGGSEKPRASYAFGDLATDVAAVLDAAHIVEPVQILAVASACMIAADFAVRYPDRTARLLLCAPALELSDEVRIATLERAKGMMVSDMRAFADGALTAMYPEALRGTGFARHRDLFLANDPVGFGLATRAFAESNVDFTKVAQPVLLLAGGKDIRPVAQIEGFRAKMIDARVEVVEMGGHMMAQQAPQDIAGHARRFFDLQ